MTIQEQKENTEETGVSRRGFLGLMGAGVATTAVALVSVDSDANVGNHKSDKKLAFQQNEAQYQESLNNPPKIPNYDWNKHKWSYGVDVSRCIGCLRCMEACKAENSVQEDANHHRTWVERYVYLDGAEEAIVDSPADPKNIENVGSETHFRFDNRYKDEKVDKAFFVPKLCNQCEEPSCVQVCPTGATFKAPDGVVLIDTNYCFGCQYCIQACPYGVRSLNAQRGTAEKCNWCYHRITKGLNPACVEVCPTGSRVFGDLNDKNSPISLFIKNNQVTVLKSEMGNKPNLYYAGADKEVS
jgi:Fe-S-cluster-containing dehydrogenase component